MQSAVTTAAPAITPAMQKQLAAAAAAGAVGNSTVSSNIATKPVNSPNTSSPASTAKDQGRSRPSDYLQPSASGTSSDTSSVTNPVQTSGSCGSDRISSGIGKVGKGILFEAGGFAALAVRCTVALPASAAFVAACCITSAVCYGYSQTEEGLNEIYLGIIKDNTSKAHNSFRDDLFGGNQELYDLWGHAGLAGSGAVIIGSTYIAQYGYQGLRNAPFGRATSQGFLSNNFSEISNIIYDSQQLGKKWGKHMADYPAMESYVDYQTYANEVFSSPNIIIYDPTTSEYLFVKGNDLLRLTESGEFISLYPGADSKRVMDAIANGGIIWPQH